jgi:endoglucanase
MLYVFRPKSSRSRERISQTSILLTFLFLAVVWAHAANHGFIRTNQLGYQIGTNGRAYLMLANPQNNTSFHILDSQGTPVFSGIAGANAGIWGKFAVYPLDFKISVAGTYTIVLDKPLSATSFPFSVDTAEKLYSQALRNALNFYQNERDGRNFIRTPLRSAAAHLNDEQAAVYEMPSFNGDDLILGDLRPTGAIVDASGGWWDAGDYVKFVQTHSYTLALMLVGIRDFPEQMGAGSQANFTNEARFGLQWLEKMWDDKSSTLYYQVGIGTGFADDENVLSDHDFWRLPQVDDSLDVTNPNLRYVRNRPVLLAGPAGSKISPNLAGRLTADFAACYQIFRESNPSFANKCLLSAEHIFALADPSPVGDLLTVAPFDFYGETEWRDDMELGATELYFALTSANGPLPANLPQTDPGFYLRAAAHWAHAFITGPEDAGDTLNLYDVSGLAHFELFRAISVAHHPAGLEVSQKNLLHDMHKQLNNAIAQADSDPFGFGYPWGVYDTVTHGTGQSVMAKEYSFLTNSKLFDGLSRQWAGNVLGANAWGSSFIVGDGQVFPNCMQHQPANIVGSLDGTFPILSGAVVEGPNSFAARGFLDGMRECPPLGGNAFARFNGNGAVYKDNQESYSTVEPAIDLSASSFLMFSWQIAGQPAQFLPSADISSALDEPMDTTLNPKWVTRTHRKLRAPAKYMER